jgi:quercetin dioxygenase-like cupin family protein
MRGMIKQLIAAALALGLAAPAEAVPRNAPKSPHETVMPLASQPISDIPGKRLVSVIVDYPPGAASLPHRHAGSAFIYAYVVSGEIRSAVDAEPSRVFRAGEGWFEQPGAHHVVSENASASQPARLLAIFIVDEKDEQLTTPDRP